MRFTVAAGHNRDKNRFGAVGLVKESELNRAVAVELVKILTERGHSAVDVTPYNGIFRDSAEGNYQEAKNVNMIMPDLHICIHHNASGGTGSEVLVDRTLGKSYEYAKKVLALLCERLGTRKRGVKAVTGYIVLRDTKVPAILTEALFVDRKEDVDKFNAKKEALAIADALVPVQKSGYHAGFDSKNNVAVMAFRPEFLEIKKVNARASQIQDRTFINGTFYDPATMITATFAGMKNNIIKGVTKDNGYPQGVMFCSPSGKVEVRRIKYLSELPAYKWFVGGITILGDKTYDPAAEGYRKGVWTNGKNYDFTDVLGKRPKTFLGYYSDGFLRAFVTKGPCPQEDIIRILRAYEYGAVKLMCALQLDGGGSCHFRSEGKDIVLSDGRKLDTIITVKG